MPMPRFANLGNPEVGWLVPLWVGSKAEELGVRILSSQNLWKALSSEEGRLETKLTHRHRKIRISFLPELQVEESKDV